jgi:acid phosphatase
MNAAYSRSFLIFGVVVTLLSLYWGYTSQCPAPAACPLPDREQSHPGYLEYECAGKPHHSSWSSWWHPQRNDGSIFERRQGAGVTTKDWNILYHLGGNGPWVEKVIDVVDTGIAVPNGCKIEQVHMVSVKKLFSNCMRWIANLGAR